MVLVWGMTVMPKVRPSGLDWAKSVRPTCQPAPGLFTTFTGAFSAFSMPGAIRRAPTSLEPPALEPTIRVMGLPSGKVVFAAAGAVVAAAGLVAAGAAGAVVAAGAAGAVVAAGLAGAVVAAGAAAGPPQPATTMLAASAAPISGSE